MSSLESFRSYQRESAGGEHQALTRARFGWRPRDRRGLERIRCEVPCMRRDLDSLGAEVLAMWHKMRDAHGSKGEEVSDLKHDAGGLIDVEFLIQYLVLGHSHDHPRLTGNSVTSRCCASPASSA